MNSGLDASNNTAKNKAWFRFTLLYLVIEYIRPQDVFRFLEYARPGLVINIILILFIINNGIKGILKIRQVFYITLFILLLAVYVPFSVNNYYAYRTVLTMLSYMPFIISTIICLDSIERLKYYIAVWVICTNYVAIYSIFNNGKGSGNYFLDENDTALFINTGMPICYYLLLNCKDRLDRLYYSSSIFIGIVSIIKSYSRGGLIGLLSILIVIWCMASRKILSLIVLVSIGTAFLLYASTLPGARGRGETYLAEMATSANPNEGTARERLLTWGSAWDMFLDNPLGVGGNNFQVRFPEYQSDNFPRGMWGRVAHSLWFTLLPELGIFGILIYFGLLHQNVKDIFALEGMSNPLYHDTRYYHQIGLAIFAAFVGYHASATFLSVLYYPHYWYLTGIVVSTTRLAPTLKLQT